MKPSNGLHNSARAHGLHKSHEPHTRSSAQHSSAVTAEKPAPLTGEEIQQLKQCEASIRSGLKTFFEVGAALLAIREGNLYRATHRTFADYCADRWGIGRTYSWRLTGAAERLKLLPSGDFPKPLSESQSRPFLKLKPQEFPAAWIKVLQAAKGHKLTAKLVNTLIDQLSVLPPARAKDRTKGGQTRDKRAISVGGILALVYDVKTKVHKGERENAVVVLRRLETAILQLAKTCDLQIPERFAK